VPGLIAFNNPPRLKIIIGDQSNPQDLEKLYEKAYDIIIDDGLHASMHQQISLVHLWKTVKPGGCYIIEDLHYQPAPETCTLTKQMLRHWQKGDFITTEYVDVEFAAIMGETVERIDLYRSQSHAYDPVLLEDALAIIWKKKET